MQNISNPEAVLTVFEYQVIKQSHFVDSDFEWLIAKVESEKLPCFNLAVKSGQVVLIVRHYLSVINLPSGITLEILPKISSGNHESDNNDEITEEIIATRKWVAQMLLTVYDIKSQHMASLANSHKTNHNSGINQQLWIHPIIEQWLTVIQNLEQNHHLPRHYSQQHQNQPQAQGKLLIKQQLKHNIHRPHYRYTNQNKFESNPLWRQFFYTILIKITNLNLDVKTIANTSEIIHTLMIHHVSAHNTEIQPLTIDRWKDSYYKLQHSLQQSQNQQDRQTHNQLSLALNIGWQILQLFSIQKGSPIFGTELTSSVMINMNQAFEKWVTKVLQRKYGSSVKSQSKSVWLTNTEANVSQDRYLQPDIVIQQSFDSFDGSNSHQPESVFVVADVKYKVINQQTDVSSADLYQLFTYHQHWQAKQAWLIFPQNEGFSKSVMLKSNEMSNFEVVLIPFDIKNEVLIFD